MREVSLFSGCGADPGLRVVQLTDDPKDGRLTYPDQPSFLADGRRLVLHTSDGACICDPDDGGTLRPLFADGRRPAVSVTFDGRYAFHEHREDGRLTIRRLDLETLQDEAVFAADGKLPGTCLPAARFRVATVSLDNRRLACSAWVGDGTTADAPYGIFVLDLETGAARQVTEDCCFHNAHLQYCRSPEPQAAHDLLIQMNHGSRLAADGKTLVSLGPPADLGVDVHAVRDDGTNWRDLPFGRDGHESCIGHQIWRGDGQSAVTVTLQNQDNSYGWADGAAQEVVAGWPIPAAKDGPHLGRLTPGARRTVLSAGFPKPRFCHLACDAGGRRFAFDTFPIFDGARAGMRIYLGSAPDDEAPLRFGYVLNSGVVFNSKHPHMHAHPILSPDGRRLFFNSDLSGTPQAYMVTELAW